jgi:transposase
VWAEDEARLGLKPIIRRVWALRGTRPTASGRTKYQWLYAYGFARPTDGRSALSLLPAANTDWMSRAMEEFARRADPEGRKLLVLLLDGAGWHTAKRLAVPANVVLHRLPPSTPELSPAEPLWPLLREAVANRGYDDLEAMQGPLIERCRWLMAHPEEVRGAVGFGWAAALDSS